MKEEIIEGIERSIKTAEKCGYDSIAVYFPIDKAKEFVSSIRKLLTRLLTEEEMDEYIRESDGSAVFWIEERATKTIYVALLASNNWRRCDKNFFELRSESYYCREVINISWRCWNRKPTDKQRDETPWVE